MSLTVVSRLPTDGSERVGRCGVYFRITCARTRIIYDLVPGIPVHSNTSSIILIATGITYVLRTSYNTSFRNRRLNYNLQREAATWCGLSLLLCCTHEPAVQQVLNTHCDYCWLLYVQHACLLLLYCSIMNNDILECPPAALQFLCAVERASRLRVRVLL